MEASYVRWKAAANASWYNVYYKADGGSFVKLDAPLVRQYSDYFRADAVGLKAGTYEMKVVPVDSEGAEATAYAGTVTGITVIAHERTGFAFSGGTSSGAYNDDGTLKAGAKVLYITEQTKDTVSMEVAGATVNPCVGLQNILSGYAKGKENTPLDIRFVGNITDLKVMDKGDIAVENKLNAKPGITLEGIGADSTINGWGIRLKNAANVEVRNLGFMNCNSDEGDCLGLQQNNKYVWVHNNDFFYGDAGSDADQAKGDGSLDTKKSTNVTHSYNHFWDSGKCNLQGMKSETTDNRITYHHNWYDHSDSRHPRIRTCTVHIYNNYFDGNAKYGVGVTMGASAFVENNYFRSTDTMKPMLSSSQGTDAQGEGTFSGEAGGIIKAYGNVYAGSYKLITQKTTTDKTDIDCYEASSRTEVVPADYKTKSGGTTYNNFDTDSDMYDYKVDSAEVAKEKVQKYAGRIGGGDFKWTFDNTNDDPFYGVNAELKSSLTKYDDKIVRIGGGSAGSSPVEPDPVNPDPFIPDPVDPVDPDPVKPDEPAVEGEIIYFPSRDGYEKDGIALSLHKTSNKALEEMYILGVSIAPCTAAKMDSNQHVTFTPGQNMKLKLYLMVDNVKINGVKVTGTDEGDYFVVETTVEAGVKYDVTKGDGENALYCLVLTPIA